MQEHLVGYLLKALDPETEQAVEAWLASHPEGQQQLEDLRKALAPLIADAELEPPAGLALRALARVAEYRCQLPPSPPSPPRPKQPPRPAPPEEDRRPWLSRADLLVGAAILIVVAGLIASWLVRQQQQAQIAACQNNLRKLWSGFEVYSEHHHGAFPMVLDGNTPHSVAGIFIPALEEAGALGRGTTRGCPTIITQHGRCRADLSTLTDLYHTNPSGFRSVARHLAGGYAYTLGYRENGVLCGLRSDMDSHLPLLADEPPLSGDGNSPNHGGKGQNVLYIGGNVRFWENPYAGIDGDDIYHNRAGRVAAGLDITDTVLGPGDAMP
jgi:hypothetical protein